MGDDAPYGPHKIAQNGQVVIPKDVLKRANLSPGESVYVAAREGIVELVPASTLREWVRRGRADRPDQR
jgi:AbrB family looped-hinge helix DNA binding protein